MSRDAVRGMLAGHRAIRLGIGPFAGVVPALLVAIVWFGAATAWAVLGSLPGGRWLVVHMVTLGVLSNLLIAFSQHFGRSVTRASQSLGPIHLAVLNAGILALLVGMVSGRQWVLAAGATGVLAVVVAGHQQLGRMRRSAPQARFGWVVATYQRAHEALAAGAVLGAALGAGLIPGDWYASVRLAHLHLNILGWTGLIVLATLSFFAPAMLRVRIPEHAEARAARSLRGGAAGLLVGTLLLTIPTAGPFGVVLRLGAAAAVAVYGWPVLSVARSVVQMARLAHPCAARPLLPVAMGWFALAVAADVAVVATGAQHLQPALGLAFGLGVLLPLVVAVGLYVVPSLRGRGFAARDALIARTEHGSRTRAAALNTAVLGLVAGAALPDLPPEVVTNAAWAVVLAVVLQAVVLAAAPVRPDPTAARSSVARRYRAAHPDPDEG